MTIHARNSTVSDALRRLLAAGCATLVFLLGLMTVNPALHALVHVQATTGTDCQHGHSQPEPFPAGTKTGHLCAVLLFAQGLTHTAQAVAPVAPPVVWHEIYFTAVEEPLLTAPPYLHQPERGPPVA